MGIQPDMILPSAFVSIAHPLNYTTDGERDRKGNDNMNQDVQTIVGGTFHHTCTGTYRCFGVGLILDQGLDGLGIDLGGYPTDG